MKLNLKDLPQNSGVYLFKNKNGQVIYVGKALNLKNRISSYFQKNFIADKTKLLVEEIEYLETIQVDSEIEALILEAKLIKKFQPHFNSQLKDDKDYLYILVTKEDYPAVLTGRKQDLFKAKDYFGPFPSANAAKSTLRFLRKVIPFRVNCRPNSNRGCLGYHIGLCPGVCAGVISRKDYQKQIFKVKKFLNGDSQKLIKELKNEVKAYSKNLEYEKAAEIQNKVRAIEHITKPIESVEKYLSGPNILESRYQTQMDDLVKDLNLKTKLHRIECYDISNTSGTNATGSMVVLIDGQTARSEYRKFKIKTIKSINDPAMMEEVLNRRFHNDWELPNLIIVDGGKTQLGAGLKVLQRLNLSIPIVGLAKKLEELYLPGKTSTIRFKSGAPALLLLQRIRDEAHRFAISYHRLLRGKNFIPK